MQNLTYDDGIIDVEEIAGEFPDGSFIAKVHDDSFDEQMFSSLFPERNAKGWIQLLVVG